MKTLPVILFVAACGSAATPQPPLAPRSPIPASTMVTMASWTPPARDLGPAMAVAAARPERCSLRVAARGVLVDGEPMTVDEAIVVCSQRSAVLVELADDADPEQWKTMDAAFLKASVPVLMRGTRGQPADCADNPLAKGCM